MNFMKIHKHAYSYKLLLLYYVDQIKCYHFCIVNIEYDMFIIIINFVYWNMLNFMRQLYTYITYEVCHNKPCS